MKKTQPLPLDKIIKDAEGVIQKARRHSQAINGGGFYAQKFAELHATATVAFTALSSKCSNLPDSKLANEIAEVKECLRVFFAPDTAKADRIKAKQRFHFLLTTEIDPAISKAPAHEATDEFFPMEIVKGTGRAYIVRIAEQACGAYDFGWYDCAAVMARRLLETLIIEVYEAKVIDSKLKKGDGTFHYLSVLIGTLLNETAFNISRNTKNALPDLKDLGDQSAHSRRYTAKKADLDKIKRGLRVTLEELVHLAGFK